MQLNPLRTITSISSLRILYFLIWFLDLVMWSLGSLVPSYGLTCGNVNIFRHFCFHDLRCKGINLVASYRFSHCGFLLVSFRLTPLVFFRFCNISRIPIFLILCLVLLHWSYLNRSGHLFSGFWLILCFHPSPLTHHKTPLNCACPFTIKNVFGWVIETSILT